MLLALDQIRILGVRIVDNLAGTLVAASLTVDSELVEPGQIVSVAGHNETTALVAAVKQNPQSDGAITAEELEMSLSPVDFVGFGFLLAPLTWCQLTVESSWTQL